MGTIREAAGRPTGLRTPMLGALLPFATGVWLSLHLFADPFTLALAVLVTAGLAWLAVRRKAGASALLSLWAGFFLAGWGAGAAECLRYRSALRELVPIARAMEEGEAVRAWGCTEEAPESGGDGLWREAVVRVRGFQVGPKIVPANLGVRLRIMTGQSGNVASWVRGDDLEFLARFSLPRGYRNAGVLSPRFYFWNRGVLAQATCKSPLLVTVRKPGREPWMDWSRRRVGERLDALPVSDETRQVMGALLLGRSVESAELRNTYVDAGLYHLLVISGAHLSFLGLVLGWVLRLLGAGRWVRILVLLPVLGAYGIFAGGGVPVVRAWVVVAIFLAAEVLDRPAVFGNAVSAAAVGFLALRPWFLLDAGFLLTFGSVLALALVDPAIRGWVTVPLRLGSSLCHSGRVLIAPGPEQERARRVRFALERVHFALLPGSDSAVFARWAQRMAGVAATASGACLTALSVLCFLVPILVAIGFPVALTPLLSSLPAMLLTWPLVLVLLVWPLIPPAWVWAQNLAVSAATLLAGSLTALSRFFAWRPHWGTAPPLWELAVFAVALWGVIRLRRFRLLAAGGLFFLLLLALTRPPALPEGSALTVRLLDVGEGDCILLSMPGGENVLVDTGGAGGPSGESRHPERGDLSRRVVIPTLLAHGVRRVDVLILSHFDFDHAGSARGILETFSVGEVWMPLAEPAGRERLDWGVRETAARLDVPVHTLAAGDQRRVGDLRFRVVWPARDRPVPKGNRGSMALLADWHGARIFLAGDVDRWSEQRMADRLFPVQLLKVAHHGSSTATSPILLDALRPQMAVASTGSPSSYHHPSPAVVERLRARGLPLLTTWHMGELQVTLRPGLPPVWQSVVQPFSSIWTGVPVPTLF